MFRRRRSARNILQAGIKLHPVGARSRGNGCDNFSGFRIDGDHLFFAGGKQPARLSVDREAARTVARSDRPGRDDRHVLCVDSRDRILVFQIHKDLSITVAHAKFRFAAECDSAGDLSGRSVDHRSVVRSGVKGEYPIRRFVVNDRVGIFAGRDVAADREVFKAEHRHRIVASVRRKTVIGAKTPRRGRHSFLEYRRQLYPSRCR